MYSNNSEINMQKAEKSIFPLSDKDRLKVNAVALGEKYECTNQYVNVVLRSKIYPSKGKAKDIMDDAIEIIEKYKPETSEA